MKSLITLFLSVFILLNCKLSIAEGKPSFTLEPKSNVSIDYLGISNNKRNIKDRFYVNKAVIGAKGKIFYDFKYRVDIDFSNNVHERVQQAYIEYLKLDPYKVRIGRFFPAFFLDYEKSFNEWPAMGYLVNQIKDGVQVSTYGDKWYLVASYGDSEAVSKTQSGNKRQAAYIRGSYTPYHNPKEQEYVIFSIANSYLKPKTTLKYKVKPEARTNINLLQTPTLTHVNYGNASTLGVAYNKKSLSVQGEYVALNLNRDAGYKNLFYQGANVQIGYFLTGESQELSPSKGKVEGISPKDPVFEFGKKNKNLGLGAWEISGRYSVVDLNSKIKSGKIDIYTLGINWFLNENLKLSNDFILAKTDKNSSIANSTSKIALIRLEFDF